MKFANVRTSCTGRQDHLGLQKLARWPQRLEQNIRDVLDGPRPLNTEGIEVDLVAMLDQIDASLNAT